MYVAILTGGTGSGKSSAAQWLEQRGCARIDLDQLSRDVLAPGTETVRAIARIFGDDLLNHETGELDRGLLAQRAFATPEDTARLEALELPAIRQLLAERLAALEQRPCSPAVCIVEVPLLDRLDDPHGLADEVVLVHCPLEVRRERAKGRGMTGADFDARVAHQPSDAWLLSHADTVVSNAGTPDDLYTALSHWYDEHERGGWQ